MSFIIFSVPLQTLCDQRASNARCKRCLLRASFHTQIYRYIDMDMDIYA